jgi:hypothetical protein
LFAQRPGSAVYGVVAAPRRIGPRPFTGVPAAIGLSRRCHWREKRAVDSTLCRREAFAVVLHETGPVLDLNPHGPCKVSVDALREERIRESAFDEWDVWQI